MVSCSPLLILDQVLGFLVPGIEPEPDTEEAAALTLLSLRLLLVALTLMIASVCDPRQHCTRGKRGMQSLYLPPCLACNR